MSKNKLRKEVDELREDNKILTNILKDTVDENKELKENLHISRVSGERWFKKCMKARWDLQEFKKNNDKG